MIELHYDDSKDLYEGLIIENDDGVQSQVAQVLPKFREKYGKKFAAAPEMYEAIRQTLEAYTEAKHVELTPEIHDLLMNALAKAEE